MASATPSNAHSFDDDFSLLLEQLIDRLHGGAVPDLDGWIREFPQHSGSLRQMFPTLVALANLTPSPSDSRGATDTALDVADDSRHHQILGDFCLIRPIGRGGMGIVYEAEQLSLGRRVALKVLPFATLAGERHCARFQTEARAAATLDHPHIVPVYAVGEDRGVYFYAMRLIRGRSLAELICQQRELLGRCRSANDSHVFSNGEGAARGADTATLAAVDTEIDSDAKHRFRRVAEIGLEIASALGHAHAHGVLHRDVKPANILLDRDGKAWIVDFGLARLGTRDGLTMTGDVLGTLRYMSPEQASGASAEVDERTDIYSLGATLYELATLAPVFDHENREGLLYRVLHHDPPAPRRLEPSIPQDLETILLTAISKEKTSRYDSAEDLAADFERYLTDRPIHARRPSVRDYLARWLRRHRHLAWASVAALMVAVVVATIAWKGEHRRRVLADQTARQLQFQIYASQIALAQNALKAHRAADAQGHLAACSFELRDWAWRFLSRISNLSRSELHPHLKRVSFVQYSPDGTKFVTASADGHVVLHDARTERVLWQWCNTNDTAVFCACFSPDSKRIIIGDDCHTATMLDVEFGGRLFSVQTRTVTDDLRSVAFAPDGQAFAAVGGSGLVALFQSSDGRLIWKNESDAGFGIFSVDFHPTGRWLVTCDAQDRDIKVWDGKTGEILRRLTDPSLQRAQGAVAHAECVNCARYHPDGNTIVSSADDGTLKLWDAKTGELLRTSTVTDDWIRWADFSPDGRWIATASRDSTVSIVSADSLAEYAVYDGMLDYAYCVDWSPDGRSLISGGSGRDQAVYLWHAFQQTERRFAGHASLQKSYPREQSVTGLSAVTPAGLLFASHLRGSIGVWNIHTGQELAHLLSPQPSDTTSLVVLDQGKQFIAGTADGRLEIWCRARSSSSATFLLDRVIPAGGGTVKQILVDDATNNLLVITQQGIVTAYSLDNDNFAPQFTITVEANASIDTIRGQRMFATGAGGGAIRIWDAATGRPLGDLPGPHGPVTHLAASPDGELLVAGASDGTIAAWDLQKRCWLQQVRGHAGSVNSLVFHPHERVFASGAGSEIKLWSVPGICPTIQLRPQHDKQLRGRDVYALSFTPDGFTLLAGMEDGTIRAWEANSVNADVLEQRREVLDAAYVVDRIYRLDRTYTLASEQFSTVASSLSPSELQIARQIMQARIPAQLAKLRSLAVEPLSQGAPLLIGFEDELRHLLADSSPDPWLLLLAGYQDLFRGRLAGAQQQLQMLEQVTDNDSNIVRPFVDVAQAWLLTQRGEHGPARERLALARRRAQLAGSRDQRLTGVLSHNAAWVSSQIELNANRPENASTVTRLPDSLSDAHDIDRLPK